MESHGMYLWGVAFSTQHNSLETIQMTVSCPFLFLATVVAA